ncbi:DUF2752 domain-containing protein [Aggregicoccus sp. 17bor-14]|uniref:DUF2752 domain-containing protein n=1 Tax=Myxococcaceae TaxID=31 RepID=UPI0012F43D02|nr:DUF2752 domain-containing protein [Simulacricoccus sp. 17bor-14]MRI89481.1 DUF2752 domain-containing protein [Aggregicoccus sp. 17bor-14]
MKIHLPAPNRRLEALDVLGLVGLVGLLVARYIPVARLVPFWGCVLRQRTGWPCPGCGLTRVADHVAHLHFAAAWAVNPLGTVAALLFALAAVAALLHLAFKLPLPRVELSAREASALKATLLVLFVVNYAWVVMKAKFPHLL